MYTRSMATLSTRRRRTTRARPEDGRPGQRRRTRKAIIDAATSFIVRGESSSVADVARAADVSRRTIYMHFPTFEQLLIDATVGMLSQPAVDRADGGGDVAARVEA